MNEPQDTDEIDIFFPTAPCSFCEEGIKELWRIENHRGKIMPGEYCSEGCCSKDAWGPIYRNCTFVRIQRLIPENADVEPPRERKANG